MSAEPLAAFQRRFAHGLLAPNAQKGDGPRGYGIHLRNVGISLVHALRESFPVTAALVGEDCFFVLGGSFVSAHPPRQGWLSGYGAGFPDFVAQFPHLRDVPYLADVARFEWARIVVAGAAVDVGLDLQMLTALSGEQLASSQLSLSGEASLLTTRFPVIEIWEAHQATDVEAILARAEFADRLRYIVAVRSSDLAVTHTELSSGDGVFLNALVGGATLLAAWTETALAVPAYDLAEGLARLANARLLGSFAFGDVAPA